MKVFKCTSLEKCCTSLALSPPKKKGVQLPLPLSPHPRDQNSFFSNPTRSTLEIYPNVGIILYNEVGSWNLHLSIIPSISTLWCLLPNPRKKKGVILQIFNQINCFLIENFLCIFVKVKSN